MIVSFYGLYELDHPAPPLSCVGCGLCETT